MSNTTNGVMARYFDVSRYGAFLRQGEPWVNSPLSPVVELLEGDGGSPPVGSLQSSPPVERAKRTPEEEEEEDRTAPRRRVAWLDKSRGMLADGGDSDLPSDRDEESDLNASGTNDGSDFADDEGGDFDGDDDIDCASKNANLAQWTKHRGEGGDGVGGNGSDDIGNNDHTTGGHDNNNSARDVGRHAGRGDVDGAAFTADEERRNSGRSRDGDNNNSSNDLDIAFESDFILSTGEARSSPPAKSPRQTFPKTRVLEFTSGQGSTVASPGGATAPTRMEEATGLGEDKGASLRDGKSRRRRTFVENTPVTQDLASGQKGRQATEDQEGAGDERSSPLPPAVRKPQVYGRRTRNKSAKAGAPVEEPWSAWVYEQIAAAMDHELVEEGGHVPDPIFML